jgi:hypothetical protein
MAHPPWVRKELRWALDEFDSDGLVKSIVPILLPEGGWDDFPDLHRFEHWQYPQRGAGDFDRLANGISLTTSGDG